MKKSRRFLAAAMAAALTATTVPAVNVLAEENSGETITLSVAWWGGQERTEYTQKLLDLYTESHPNIKFETEPSGWEGYFDKLATEAAAGAMPDIVQMDYLYISTYANNGSIADLQPYIDNGTIDVSNIDEVLYNSGKIGDKLAGMVLSGSLLSFAYNPEVLEKAGVAEPTSAWTWAEFIEACNTIKEKVNVFGMETNLSDVISCFTYYVRQHGEELFSEDNKSLAYKDDQIFVDFVNMISGLVETGAMPNPDEYASIAAMGKESFPVVTGDSGFRNDWSNYATIAEKNNDKLKMVTPPMAEDGTKALWLKPGMFFSVAESASEEKKQAAAEFINWFVNSEEANDIILAERGTPVSSTIRDYLAESGKMSKKQIEMFEYIDHAMEVCADAPAPDPAGIAEISEVYQTEIYNVLYGMSTAEEAAQDFRTKVNELLERNN